MATAEAVSPPPPFLGPDTNPNPLKRHKRELMVNGQALQLLGRLGNGSYQVWYRAKLGDDRKAVSIGGNPTRDAAICEMRDRYFHSNPSNRKFSISQEVICEGRLIKIADCFDGRETRYAGADGYKALCELQFSRTTPYKDPVKNMIRLALLGPVEAVLDAHTTAHDADIARWVHGDIKPEQFVLRTIERNGQKYVALILIDMPSQIDPKERTPVFCPHDSDKLRYHHEDLFALQTTMAHLLFRTLTDPLFEGDVVNPFPVNPQQLYKALIERDRFPVTAQSDLREYQDRGYPIVFTPKGEAIVYPAILNPDREDEIFNQLHQFVTTAPDSPYRRVGLCLFEVMRLLQEGIDKVLELKNDPLLAQEKTIEVLQDISDYLRTNHLPLSGVTGSPQKALAPTTGKRHRSVLDNLACKTPKSQIQPRRLFGAT